MGALRHGSYRVLGALTLLAFGAISGCSAQADEAVDPSSDGTGTNESNLTVPGCAPRGGTTVATFGELMVVHPKVIGSAAASNAGTAPGHWSFRWLMEQMAPVGVDASDFTEAWLKEFTTVSALNGDDVPKRASPVGATQFPRVASGPRKGKLDLSRAPFELIAIVNRIDLRSASKPAGEARLVFAAKQGATRLPMTVIFEYNQPTSSTVTAATWAKRWHDLAANAVGTAAYNNALLALTDGITARGAMPSAPNGNAISQIRTNEIALGFPWQLREFTLLSNREVPATTRTDANNRAVAPPATGFLRQTTVKQTPRDTLNGQQALSNWLNQNATGVMNGTAVLPANLLGGDSLSDFGATWTAPGVKNEVRHRFAHDFTCNGCHFSEVNALRTEKDLSVVNGFYHITPQEVATGDGKNILSGFLLNNDLPRRQADLSNLLCPKPKATGSLAPASVDADAEAISPARVH